MGIAAILVIAISGCLSVEPDLGREADSDAPENAIVVHFGYRREPLTRVRIVDLRASGFEASESSQNSNSPSGAEGQSSEDEPTASAYLTGDLRSERREIPASQVTTSAEARGPGTVSVSVAVDPREPERISGTKVPYSGEIVVSDGQQLSNTVPLWVELRNRNELYPTAVICLLLGSLLGIVIKWLTAEAGQRGSPEGPAAEEPAANRVTQVAQSGDRQLDSLKRARQPILAVLSAVAIAFVGFQTQFSANDSFSGSPASFVALFVWALGVQLAGTALVDIVRGAAQ